MYVINVTRALKTEINTAAFMNHRIALRDRGVFLKVNKKSYGFLSNDDAVDNFH